MDTKILEFATQLTEKAMGANASLANWIGQEDKVVKFLTTIARTLDRLSHQEDDPDM